MFSFPVLYFGLMLATGRAHIEVSQPKKDVNKDREIKVMKLTASRDSLAATQSQTFLALEQEKEDIERERSGLSAQQEQVKMSQDELEKTKTELAAERSKLETLVSQSDSLDKKRTKQLAKVYAAMRPEEAARILETLDDDLCVNILSSMNDDRQKAKILAALSGEKASKISRKIGAPAKAKS
jgi:flagellar motility protein MotE (MotC chaperone)